MRPQRWQPTRLPCPWDSPGKNTGVVAISFSNAWKWKVKVKSLSHVWLLATLWTAAHQAPLSMGFSRQEYWSGVPLPSPNTETEDCIKKPHVSITQKSSNSNGHFCFTNVPAHTLSLPPTTPSKFQTWVTSHEIYMLLDKRQSTSRVLLKDHSTLIVLSTETLNYCSEFS